MASAKLIAAVTSVDWNANVARFTEDEKAVEGIASANLRLAIWSKQLEEIDHKNPAICFIREMQIAGQNTAAALSLGLYKLAASSMRSAVETALYYSYFRSHPNELATLVRDEKYYIDKQVVVEFHKLHTDRFTEFQGRVDLIGRLNSWYSKTSAVIHGQIPGTWIKHTSLKDIAFNEKILTEAVMTFQEGVEIIHFWLLLTVGRDNWYAFNSSTKQQLIKGMHGDLKTLFGLDSA